MDYYKESLRVHAEKQGKVEMNSKVPLENKDDLSIAYTPGVAQPCLEIARDPSLAYTYTCKANTVAVITDGTAVLGLGDIGPAAALPVMEGKCCLFKRFGGVNAIPLCLDTKDVDKIVDIVVALAPGLGGVNLEDISAPRCFEVERRIQERVNIPIFHDDQHGTAIVTTAAVINSLRLIGKKPGDCTVTMNGAGSAGTAITKMLLALGVRDVICCDRKGIISRDTPDLAPAKADLASYTNKDCRHGILADAMKGADIFVGVSAPKVVTEEMVRSMNKDAIVLPMANPEPEIMPDLAKKAGARIVGTGRSDFPNQINNVLAFPGIFKGALEVRATRITTEMMIAAAHAIANSVTDAQLNEEYVMPSAFDPNVAANVSKAVADAWTNRAK